MSQKYGNMPNLFLLIIGVLVGIYVAFNFLMYMIFNLDYGNFFSLFMRLMFFKLAIIPYLAFFIGSFIIGMIGFEVIKDDYEFHLEDMEFKIAFSVLSLAPIIIPLFIIFLVSFLSWLWPDIYQESGFFSLTIGLIISFITIISLLLFGLVVALGTGVWVAVLIAYAPMFIAGIVALTTHHPAVGVVKRSLQFRKPSVTVQQELGIILERRELDDARFDALLEELPEWRRWFWIVRYRKMRRDLRRTQHAVRAQAETIEAEVGLAEDVESLEKTKAAREKRGGDGR